MTTIRLCALCGAHAAAIEYYAADRDVALGTGTIPHPYPPGGGDAFVKRSMDQWREGTARTFCILVDHLEAGVIGLSDIDPDYRRAELGFWVARPYWNRGIATAAAQQILGYAREHLGLDAVWSACLADNHGSRRVHEKNGFTLRGGFVHAGHYGRRHDGRDMLRFQRSFTPTGTDQADPKGIELTDVAA